MPGSDGKLTEEEYFELFPFARGFLESLPEVTPGQRIDQEIKRLQLEVDQRRRAATEPASTEPSPGEPGA